jgi:arabinofuranosyltransferase
VSLERVLAFTRSSSRAGAWAVTIVLGLPAALLAWGFWGFSHDDAFITYRYANQWAHGNGLTFNTGEHVLGTSAAGYALLLGLLSRTTGFAGLDVPAWGTILSLAAILLVSWVLAAGLGSAPAPYRSSVPLLFGIGALLWRWNLQMLGSEALPVVALVVAGAYFVFQEEEHVLGGLALAGAMILRLDAGLAAASIGTLLWLSRKRFPWKFAVAGLAPLALWLAGLWSRFGTFIPATLAGKRAEYSTATAAYTLAEWNWLRRSLPLSGCLVLLGLGCLGAAVCVKRGLWKHPALQALALWLVAQEIAYRAVRVPFAPWYHEGLANAVLILAVFGAVAIGEGLLSWRRSGEGRLALAPALLACLILLPVLAPSASSIWENWGRPPDARLEIYRTIGQYLRQQARPESVVASVEVGMLGYFSTLPVLDLSGLVTPGVVQAKEQGHLGQFVATAKPDYILVAPQFRANVLAFLDDPEVSKLYRPAHEFSPVADNGAFRLLERASRP